MQCLRFFLIQRFANPKIQRRWIHPKAKFKLKEEIEQLIETEQIKARKHPGIVKRKNIELPNWTLEAISHNLQDYPQALVLKESKQFSNYLFSRLLPAEVQDIREEKIKAEKKFLGNIDDTITPEQLEDKRQDVKNKVKLHLKSHIYEWKAMDYNKYKSLVYMVARSASEYAVLNNIFAEIKIRDPNFVPLSILDFGSGVGSVLWAALHHWPKSVLEYIGIDISNDMHDLSEAIIKTSPVKVKGTFRRQYLPISKIKHDIVISAYSLMELPNIKNRLSVIAELWNKTNKYLIFVEQGSNAGFKVMNEARSFIKHIMENFETQSKYFIFSPCPHESPCPRYAENRSPCNFVVQHMTLPLAGPSSPKYELYTYIVFKKGERSQNDNWHRLVRPTLVRSKHARCRTCTPDGKLEEIVFTSKKNGKNCYWCARASKWGDRLPIDPVVHANNENIGTSEVDGLDHESEDTTDSETDDESEDSSESDSKGLKNEELVSKSPPSVLNKKNEDL